MTCRRSSPALPGLASVVRVILGTGSRCEAVSPRLSKSPPDEEHPYGHGKDRFFRSFPVAVLTFFVGAFFRSTTASRPRCTQARIKSMSICRFALVEVRELSAGWSFSLPALGGPIRRFFSPCGDRTCAPDLPRWNLRRRGGSGCASKLGRARRPGPEWRSTPRRQGL
jgi:hypothetical protein